MTPNSFPFVNWDIMIMYPEYKLMYIRPWKTGSTSMLEILRQNFGQGIYYENKNRPGHAYIRDIKQDPNPEYYERLKDWYVITTIRNPLTWLVSQYNFSIRLVTTRKSYDGNPVPDKYMRESHYTHAKQTFAEYINDRYLWAQENPNYPRWDQSFTNRWDHHCINLRIRMEDRETGIRELFNHYNKEWNGQDYQLNSSGKDWDIDEWYTDDLREKVQFIYQNDFKYYYPEYLL